MKIKTSLFCAMARNVRWQMWLKEQAPDLHDDLIKTLAGNSCKANKNKMMQILVMIRERHLIEKFEAFVRSEFPYLEDKPPRLAKIPDQISSSSTTRKPPPSLDKVIDLNPEEEAAVNKHKVFKSYRPHTLTFPCHLIVIGKNKEELKKRALSFTRNKIGIDWIIVEDRVYIEYFFEQHRKTLEKIKPEDREIHQYRRKNGLPDDYRGDQ